MDLFAAALLNFWKENLKIIVLKGKIGGRKLDKKFAHMLGSIQTVVEFYGPSG